MFGLSCNILYFPSVMFTVHLRLHRPGRDCERGQLLHDYARSLNCYRLCHIENTGVVLSHVYHGYVALDDCVCRTFFRNESNGGCEAYQQ